MLYFTFLGTVEERGIDAYNKTRNNVTDDENQEVSSAKIYDLPFGMSQIRKWKWTRYLPFSPTFKHEGIDNEDEETASTASTQTMTTN